MGATGVVGRRKKEGSMNGKGSILIVDDEEIVRDSLASWLRADGYQVETAPDGPTAARTMEHTVFSLMLVDLKMPRMDGLQVLSEARQKQPRAAVILMTAYATVETAVRAMKQGAHDYLVKPIDPEVLSQVVSRLAESPAVSLQGSRESGSAVGPAVVSFVGNRVLPASANTMTDTAVSLRAMERKHVAQCLRQHGWNISRTAKALGIDRVTLYNKIKRYQIREGE
jgi:DNA-binding NtrC family response regulator